ncbi:MAG TPA: undecaprenyl diphosphate synthase family protein [Methanoregula sp.]|nr:undecaprenyl diphosphate synthase family protein [Methanoregula sp.]
MGIIPDGNRRWAVARGLPKSAGYEYGIEPAKRFFKIVWDLGIKEVSTYIFTKENTHRPREQVEAFKKAFITSLDWVEGQDVSLLIVGDTSSTMFPKGIEHFTEPDNDRSERRRLNLLVSYNWKWDVGEVIRTPAQTTSRGDELLSLVGSRHVSNIDLIVRWGGRNRLSGFLPLQSAYADLCVVDAMWPDFEVEQFYDALRWYQDQDITRGG